MPDIAVAGDMIVGFCGESEVDFRASCDLLRYARYKNCFIFKYSPRPGTVADDRLADDVPDAVKRRRNNDMLAVQAEINIANHREMIGHTVEVLVEGPSKRAIKAQESEQDRGDEIDHSADAAFRNQLVGRTRGDQIVVFEGAADLIGSLAHVEITAITPYTLHGRVVGEAVRPQPRLDASPAGIALPVIAC
jgi:tRNA-2-methylthio-N6-dimethylallyladenosine synthase